MKTVAIEKLTLAHLRRLDRSIYIATASCILIILFSLFWMLFHLGGDANTILFSNLAYVITSLIGAYWAFSTAYMARKGPIVLAPRHQLAWLFVGLGLLANCVGGIYYTYLQYNNLSPFPSLSDLGFTLFYPLIFVALLLMPTALRFRIRMGLDALITTLCFFGISWFFVLGPLYFTVVKQATSAQALVALFIGLSYPCWDVLLILAIALLIQRRTERVLHPSFILLACGIIAQIWADTGYAYTNIFTHTYQTGTPLIDPFWFIGYMLMGLAGLYQYTTIAHKAHHEQQTQASQNTSLPTAASIMIDENEVANGAWRQLQSLLIYIPLACVLALTIVGELFDDGPRADYLAVLSAFIGILVAVRYLRATHENEVLLQEREYERHSAEHLRQLSTTLTSILDLGSLLESIPLLATKELGFDAAILILREEYRQKIGPHSYMLINTASKTTPVTAWRLQGDTFFYYLVLSGQDVEVRWDTLSHDVPPDIHTWQQEQHIATTNFFPLVDQDTVLGCLGIAHRTSRFLDKQSVSVAKMYAEQVVTTIKHAYLYKEACEHEAFARAMANIATRLNAAVVAPTEIQQLICTEGANALQADYAILYVTGDSGQLIALSAYDGSKEIQATHNEWPLIHPHEEEAQIFYSLQPVLIHLRTPLAQQMTNKTIFGSNSAWDSWTTESHTIPPRVREQRRTYGPSLGEALVRQGIDTAIFAPLIAGGNPVGLLVFARSMPLSTHDKQALGPESLPLAQDFAEQAAVAFTNAHLYQHLRSTHQRMQELDQLKDQFMVTASHELRTPLTAVQGYIELLSEYDEILPLDQRRDFLQKARRSCEELVVLLSNVMDASRLEVEAGIRPSFLERVDVLEMVESVITLIEPQVQQEHRMIQLAIPIHTFVLADPVRLRQVLLNLSVNALKYSPHRTPILFSASPVDTQTASIVLSVTDKGKGIPPALQGRLFQRFVRLETDINSPVRGSGLGLYISKRLVEAMGGKIWIESDGIPGEGSTFHIQLPIT